jgi:hypothetical protein
MEKRITIVYDVPEVGQEVIATSEGFTNFLADLTRATAPNPTGSHAAGGLRELVVALRRGETVNPHLLERTEFAVGQAAPHLSPERCAQAQGLLGYIEEHIKTMPLANLFGTNHR